MSWMPSAAASNIFLICFAPLCGGIAALPGGVPPYIPKVHAAGGWKKYEQAHRKRLTTTFAKAFPRLPVDAISHMVDFAFHVGFY